MDYHARQALARYGDISTEAVAFRLRAARMSLELNQKEMAEVLGLPSSSYAAYETAKAFPTMDVVRHFRREHDIDFDFILYGDYRRLRADLQERMFAAMSAIAAKGRA